MMAAASTLSKIVPEPALDPESVDGEPKSDRVHSGKNAYAVEVPDARRPGTLPVDIARLETTGLATVHVACLVCLALCTLVFCELDGTAGNWELSGEDQRLAVLIGAATASFTCALASCCLRLCRRRISSTKTKCICSVLLLSINVCFAYAAMVWPDEEQRAFHFVGISFMFKAFALSMAEFRGFSPTGAGSRCPSMIVHSVLIGSLVIDILVTLDMLDSTSSAKTFYVWPATATILAEAVLWYSGKAWKRLQAAILKYCKENTTLCWDATAKAFSFAADSVIMISSDGLTIETWDAKFQSMILASSNAANFNARDWLLPLPNVRAGAEGQSCADVQQAVKLAAKEGIAELRCLLRNFGEVDLCILQPPDESNFVVGIKVRSRNKLEPQGEDSGSEEAGSSFSSSLWRSIDSSPVCNRGKIINLGVKEHWLLDSDKVQVNVDDVIGKGGFGEVLGGTYCGTRVAIKVAKEQKRLELPLLNELQLLRYVRHPNIVLYFGACVDPVSVETALVFEFIDGETLSEFITKRPSEGHRMTVVRGISLAVAYLHGQRKPIVHGDLKGGNVFVEKCNDSVRAKIGDFGISKRLSRTPQRSGGTIRWTAPEILRDGNLPAATSADIYSFGCVLLFCVTHHAPFSMYKQDAVSAMIRENAAPALDWQMGTLFEQAISTLGKQCTCADPRRRLLAQEVVNYLKVLPRFEDDGEPGGEPDSGCPVSGTWVSDCEELLRSTRGLSKDSKDEKQTPSLGTFLRTPPSSPALMR